MMARLVASSWHQICGDRRVMMSKLFLRVGVPALGSFIFVSGTHAALRVADAGAMSVTWNTPKPSCATCGQARMPWTGDMTTLDPQPLPPKVYGDGRMLRR
jgi:hypothetical protein